MAIPALSSTPSDARTSPTSNENVRSGKSVAPPLPTGKQLGWGLGALGVFLLPFCAVGVGAGYSAVRNALAGNWKQAGFSALFAVVFGGVGFGLLAGVVYGRRQLSSLIARAQVHPDEPWLWREDWAAKHVRDASQSGTWVIGIGAAVWNLIAIPVGIAVFREVHAKGSAVALLGLLFPLAGVAIAVSAVRRILQYRRFGTSYLDLERVPIPVGHRLVGTVRANVATPPADGFRVVLSQFDRVTVGSGEDRSTSEHTRWQEERRVPGAPVRDYRGAGTIIPIEFDVPADARGTDESQPGNQALWRVSVSASIPGVDYESQFEVPVYYTQESTRPAPRQAAERFTSAVPEQPAAPSPITVTRDAEGTAIVFPAFRNPSVTLSFGAFTLLWTATIWLQRYLGAPLFFPLVTGLVALFLWWIVLAMAFGSSRVIVNGDGLTVTRRFLGISRRPRSIAAADIDGIEMPIQMQAGSTPYYSILVRRRPAPGRSLAGSLTLAFGIRDKRETERLVAAINEALGRRL